jgi:NAD(P)-dependent dehydrogenase (short-subunit alcohol dehydrogenase family)
VATYTGSVALVTGGGSGMGRLAVERFAAAGAIVAALDLDADGLAAAADGRPDVHTFTVDVTDADAVASVVQQVEEQCGPIDRVMTAAGIMPTGKLVDMPTPLIQKVMDVNYGGSVNVVKVALPPMLDRGRGDVVMFASMSGLIPGLMLGAYNASKAAVVAFCEVLSHEHRDSGIRFACVCPPLVDTPLLAKEKEKLGQLRSRDPLQPGQVLDAIEDGLEHGRPLVFADRTSAIGWKMRRYAPSIVWRVNHKEEGW